METLKAQKEQAAQSKKNNSTFFKPVIQKKLSVGSANDSYENQSEKCNGNIPENIKNEMEYSFNSNFSDVILKENSTQAKNLNAIAFAQGNEIHFASSFNPHSNQSKEILGHELAHVIQQRSGIVNASHQEQGFNINDDYALENEADAAGRKAANGEKAMLNTPASQRNNKTNQKNAGIQLLREPVPSSAIILEVNASTEVILQELINTAAQSRPYQYDTVNWRQIFFPIMESQIRGRQLGAISHSFTDTDGLDCDWSVSISFSIDNLTSIRTETGTVTSSQGGSSTPSLGSSQLITTGQTAGVQGSVTNAPGGVGTGGNVSASATDSNARGSSQGATGGLSGMQSHTSTETINRFRANLFASISVTSAAGYSNWDIINPVKWGAHLAGTNQRTRVLNIGTIVFNRPQY
ncbi:DUF4157 domain-containing protein [Chryseobacterium sp. PS-8]|uniref:DUF4157 domain-containing protein n=1 Tax=Chryseobacterium indicum TaxID=2766954 RepID=A0ABS9C5N9_9FLAO|nr:DUF4157 domain-containing protein [Chryseobacterium sp. PS-8]MCF2219895.1 DUF4157 domain-containing protein [Chryseobacterium sp. PS-8]